jgi:ubiquinone/menaquinone biosynthesis C-methylase UbiE
MPDVLRAANRAAHVAGVGLGLPLHLASRILEAERPPTPAEIRAVRRRRFELVDRDLANARAGHYPLRLVFERRALHDVRAWPLALKDFLVARHRRERRAWRLATDPGPAYPRYYRRRFHWQKDGYLSARSALRYDLGVEMLFLGAADTMRRQVIPPLTAVEGRAGHPPRILDVGCGTGRTLDMLAAAMPDAALTGIDLSPPYVERARHRCRGHHLSLVVGNAEALPFPDGHFDAVTSTFLFHELPRAVRRTVAAEMVRVCRPGGRIVIEDAAQTVDSADLGPLLHAFHQSLHEPYFADHLADPIEDWLAQAGTTQVRSERCYVAKVVVAEVPAGLPGGSRPIG